MPPDPKVVFDCNIFVQAFFNANGPAASCVRLVENEIVKLLLSAEVLAELRDALNRPKLQKKSPSASSDLVDEFLRRLLDKAEFVKEVGKQFSCERDPKDDVYVNLALSGGASYLISRDHDLLDLVKETKAGTDFRARFPGLNILNPVAFLRAMEKANTELRDDG